MPLFTSMPPRIGDYERLGGIRSLDRALGFTPYPGLFNHMGLPAIAVPAERTHAGFPLAVQIVGPRESEGKLLSLAAQLEAAIGWPDRRPPGFEAAA
jgi:amidase